MNTRNFKIEIGFGIEFTKDKKRLSEVFVKSALNAIRKLACQQFGGCTLVKTQGDWLAPDGHRFEEKGCTLFFFIETEENPVGDRVREMVKTIKVLLNQEAVALSIIPCNTYIL